MDQEELSQVAQAFEHVLEKRSRIDGLTHSAHHEYVGRLIERDRSRRERWDKVRVHVYGWSAVTAIAGTVYGLGEWVKGLIANVLKVKGGP